jgi:hypothetical protein
MNTDSSVVGEGHLHLLIGGPVCAAHERGLQPWLRRRKPASDLLEVP